MGETKTAYIAFTDQLRRQFDAAGVQYQKAETPTGVLENKGWVDFTFPSGHKVYVPKGKTRLGPVETTFSFDPRLEGVVPLPENYKNGLIRSRLSSLDPERVARLVIAALRSGAPSPQKRAPQRRDSPTSIDRQVTQDDLDAIAQTTPDDGDASRQ